MNKKTTTIIMIVLVIVLLGAVGYLTLVKQPTSNQPTNSQNTNTNTTVLPTSCVDVVEGVPVITSLSSYSGPVGTQIDVIGCNFAGFEGDKNAWIEDSTSTKGIMYGLTGSTSNLVKVTLTTPLCQQDTSYSGDPCPAQLILVPGVYTIYTNPWGTPSNQATFTIL